MEALRLAVLLVMSVAGLTYAQSHETPTGPCKSNCEPMVAVSTLADSSIGTDAQTFTSMAYFDGTNGAGPVYENLVQGTDGNFYGTTYSGGANGFGSLFRLTPAGKLTTLHSFYGVDGANPFAGLVLATDGSFYGTTQFGGVPCNCGTIFKITPAGTLTTLHSFNVVDGDNPAAGLVQATNGNFYGTTEFGGAGGVTGCNCGTIFKITSAGSLVTLHSFSVVDGANPAAGLVQATNGNFYGTTEYGGAGGVDGCNCGTIFKITPEGSFLMVHSFNVVDGANPTAKLLQAANGNFYGTTQFGGAGGCYCGTIFKFTPAGSLTTLHSFSVTDGANPYAGLVQATNENLYGTTQFGGASGCNCGTVFVMMTGGTLKTLYSFNLTDGANPEGGLVQGTNGEFYGTTGSGGSVGYGTAFSISVGLGPFVEALPASGKPGAVVKILGTNLADAVSVNFNGTTAPFQVVSPSEIEAFVPTGATTGEVEVTTPGGTRLSNLSFQVLP